MSDTFIITEAQLLSINEQGKGNTYNIKLPNGKISQGFVDERDTELREKVALNIPCKVKLSIRPEDFEHVKITEVV